MTRKKSEQDAADQPAAEKDAAAGSAKAEPAEATPDTEGQLAGEHEGGRAVLLHYDEHGEGHPLSEAELSGQKADEEFDGIDRQVYEEKPDPADKHQLNKPR